MTAGRTVGQCHVHVTGDSNAPPIVLLHSIATSGAMWAPQLAIWAQRFRVLNVDLPGHGAAPAPADPVTFASLADALVAILDAHEIERAGVVGLSFGGMIAQALALSHPRRVHSLVLAHTAASLPPGGCEAWRERIAAVETGGLSTQVAATLERWLTPAFRQRAPLTVAWVAGLIRATSARGFVAAAKAIRQLDHLDRLAGIEAPTLIVAGRHDTAAPLSAAEAMAGAITNSTLRVLDCAHLGNVEQAIELTEIVGAHLAEPNNATTRRHDQNRGTR